jgi:hypothetical protein
MKAPGSPRVDGVTKALPIGVQLQVTREDSFLEERSIVGINRGELGEPELTLKVMDGRGDGIVAALVGRILRGRSSVLPGVSFVVGLSPTCEGIRQVHPVPKEGQLFDCATTGRAHKGRDGGGMDPELLVPVPIQVQEFAGQVFSRS